MLARAELAANPLHRLLLLVLFLAVIVVYCSVRTPQSSQYRRRLFRTRPKARPASACILPMKQAYVFEGYTEAQPGPDPTTTVRE